MRKHAGAACGIPRRLPFTVLDKLASWYRIADEIDHIALAGLLGTTPRWVMMQAARPPKRHTPRLACKRAPGQSHVRNTNNRLVFDIEDVSTFVSDVERLVSLAEAPPLRSVRLPLVTATDPRIGTAWNTLDMFHSRTSDRWNRATRSAFGEPTAFFISSARCGYSVVWSGGWSGRRTPAANDNAPTTLQARGRELGERRGSR